MYKFSESTVATFYGTEFYAISNDSGEIVAYSEKVFEIHERVKFIGEERCLIFEKAIIRGGEIRGGEIRGGEIWGGEIRGGVIRGGEIWGGEIRGGVIRGGVIRGGVIRGGEIWGGEYTVSMLQIQGTKHFAYAYFSESGEVELAIGCERHSIDWWLENYQSIGQEEDYSQDEIEEYKAYIDLFAIRYTKKLKA